MPGDESSLSRLFERLRLIVHQPALIPELAGDYVPTGLQQLFEQMRGDAALPRWFYQHLSAPRALSLRPGTRRPICQGMDRVTGLPEAGGLPIPVFRAVAEEIRAERQQTSNDPRAIWFREKHRLRLPLTNDELGRQRYIPPFRWKPDIFGPRFSLGIGMYYEVLDRDQRSTLTSWLERLEPYIALCQSTLTVVAIFKAVEGWAKTAGDLFRHWRVPCGIALLGGYQPAPPLEFFRDEVSEWVSGPLPEIGQYLPGWRDSFEWASKQLLTGCGPEQPPDTFEDYVLRGDWVRPGATDQGTFPVVTSRGEDVSVRRTKVAMFAATAPDDLLALAYSPAQPPRAMVKRELTKARAVVITDTPSYLRMSWISTALEPLLRRSRNASVFFSGKRLAKMWADLASDSADVALWKCPIDQSKFDHMVEPWALSVILDRIEELITGDQAKYILRLIRRDLIPEKGTVTVGEAEVPVTKGVLSGWRWTALLDTWVNFSQVVGTLHYLYINDVVPSIDYTGWYFQGDDARLIVRNPGIAVAVAEVMREAGLKIHPSKTWLSPFRDEFLRQVAENSVTMGYLARSVPALLWRNPINAAADNWPAAARAAVGRWDGLVLRGADPGRVLKHAIRELTHLIPYPRSTIRKWLSLPPHLGGAGVTWVTPDLTLLALIRYPLERSLLRFDGVGLFDRLVSQVDLPRNELYAKCYQYLSDVIDTHEPKHLYRDTLGSMPGPTLEWKIPPKPWPPLGLIPCGAPPAQPVWAKGLQFPNWFRNVVIDVAVRTKTERSVDVLLEPYSASHSPIIRARHGRSTWAVWAKGALSLPVRCWPGWDKGYLATQYRARIDTFIRCYLGSSRRWGSRARLASEVFFYSIQRCPDSLYPYRIAA